MRGEPGVYRREGAGGAAAARWTRRAGLRAGALIATGASGGALAACATAGGPAGDSARSLSTREVTISYVTDWSSGTRQEWIKAAIPRFTEENPRIKVQADNWTGEVSVTALANAAAGTLQDVMLGSNDVFITLVRAGGMRDIASTVRSLKWKMEDIVYLPSTLSYEGKQYGMPFQFIVQALVINKTLFRQAGATLPTDKTTYPELLEQLRKISRPAENVWGWLGGGGGAGNWGQWLPFVWGYGGDRWTPDKKKTLLDTPGSIEGLQFFVDMMTRHGAAAPVDEKGSYAQGLGFTAGNVAVAGQNAPGGALDRTIAGKFEWDVMYHPIGPRAGKRNVFANDQANTVTASAVKHDVFEQAVQFCAWCACSKTAQDLVVSIAPTTVPVLKSVLGGQAYLAGPPASLKILLDQAPNYRDPEIFIGWNEWRDEVYKALVPAFAGTKSVPDAARDATRAGDVVLGKIPR